MPFAIRERGSPSGLIKHLDTVVETGSDGKPAKDQSQLDAVKALAVSELKALGKEVTFCELIIEGFARESHRLSGVQIIAHKGHA